MESLLDASPLFSAYKPSLIVLSAICLMTLIQNVLTAPLAFAKEEQVPGMPLQFDHEKLSFRVMRTYQNSAESLPAFGFVILLAIVVGASSNWVNSIAIVYLISRVAFWVTYYTGVGRVTGGPRTATYVLGLLANTVLVVIVIFKLM